MPTSVSVIGLGHVGLPLALAFADRGIPTIGVDVDADRLQAVRDGRMPFREQDGDEVMRRVHGAGSLRVSDSTTDAAESEHIVLTLGTPSLSHIEIDMSQIRGVLDELLPLLRPGHSIILRSTIAPGTTEFVAGYIEKQRGLRAGEEIFVSHVPERIAAHRFFAEIDKLPQIVGGVGAGSGAKAAELFSTFQADITQATPVEAELAKIWTNIYRYATFALPNLLMIDCEQYGANVFQVIEMINRSYPRGGIARPGLTAGTCLRKDFAFSEERSAAPGMLLAVSRVNESVPHFLVQGIKRRLGDLRDRRVAVLGLTFKANSDDLRDSLSAKLVRLLERELATVVQHDSVVPTLDGPLERVVTDADVVICAMNHDEYVTPEALGTIRAYAAADCLLVDPWNAFGAAEVFTRIDELDGAGAAVSDAARVST
jgi:UDP-N-acetyl-D-mannosaminuronic acid dehydrogenase